MNNLLVDLPILRARLAAVQAVIRETCLSSGRGAHTVRLIAVSKAQTEQSIRLAYQAGQKAFGENYLQEAVVKMEQLVDLPDLEWHFIGSLQANKTEIVATHFAWVHSIDRLRIAERLSKQRPSHLPSLQVCVQVNISGETNKGGVLPGEAAPLCLAVNQLPKLQLRGLMGIAAPTSDAAQQKRDFHLLWQLYEESKRQGIPLDTLSMGMSDDFPAAIVEGATLLRIGTALFGERPQKP